MKTKILYIHPAIRTYRLKIFELLFEKLGVEFFWSGKSKEGTYIYEEVQTILKKTNIKYRQSKEMKNISIDNFSLSLLLIPFQGYKIYIFSNITSVPFLLLAPFLKIIGKKIILFDELWRYPYEVKKYKKIYSYVKFLSKYCLDAVVVAGSKARQFYINEFSFNEDNVFIAYNTTIDTKEYVKNETLDENIKNKLKMTTDKKKILYLGRIVEYKGLDLLIKAFAKISDDYDLIVVGDGDFKKHCVNQIHDLKMDQRVHFLGSCMSNEALYYYKNCDMFVLPTKFKLSDSVQTESWGFTVNEAMAMEIPVVTTTAVGSGYDLIIDEKTGGLVEAGNVDSLAEKINYILKNNKNNIIGKNGRKHLQKTCNYDQNYLAYKNAIENVLKYKKI